MIVEAVLDTGALMAYMRGVDRVGELLFRAAEDRFAPAVPSTCLIEAYSGLSFDEIDILRVLRLLPVVLVDEPQTDVNGPDHLPIIGGMAAKAARTGAGHAALTAASHSVAVYTSLPHQIEAVLGKTLADRRGVTAQTRPRPGGECESIATGPVFTFGHCQA